MSTCGYGCRCSRCVVSPYSRMWTMWILRPPLDSMTGVCRARISSWELNHELMGRIVYVVVPR